MAWLGWFLVVLLSCDCGWTFLLSRNGMNHRWSMSLLNSGVLPYVLRSSGPWDLQHLHDQCTGRMPAIASKYSDIWHHGIFEKNTETLGITWVCISLLYLRLLEYTFPVLYLSYVALSSYHFLSKPKAYFLLIYKYKYIRRPLAFFEGEAKRVA